MVSESHCVTEWFCFINECVEGISNCAFKGTYACTKSVHTHTATHTDGLIVLKKYMYRIWTFPSVDEIGIIGKLLI